MNIVNCLMFILNTKNDMIFLNCSFSKNFVKWQIINSENLQNEIIKDTQCLFNNEKNKENSQFHQYYGGCFRSYNVLYRRYENVTINNSLSDLTNVGLKLIDDNVYTSLSYDMNYQIQVFSFRSNLS